LGIELVFHVLDTSAQAVDVVVFEDGDSGLGEDGAGVDAFIDQVNGTTGEFNAGFKGLEGGMGTGEGGEEGRVYIKDAERISIQEAVGKQAHKPGQADEVYGIFLQQLDEEFFIVLPIASALMRHEEGRDAGFSTAGEGVGGGDVGDDQADFSGGVGHIELIDEGLQVAAITRSQNSNAFH